MTVVYYAHELDTILHVDGTITGAVANGLEEALSQFLDEIQEPGAGVKTLRFLTKGNAISQAVVEVVDVYFNGDQLVIGAALVDASATALITHFATVLTGLNPIALAIGASLYWSAVNDESVEQFFTDADEFFEWMIGTIDIDVQLVDKTSGNLYAGGFYADGFGSVTPSEAVVGLLENAAELGVSTIDPTQHQVKIYEGEENETPELIHDFQIHAPELAQALANAMTEGNLVTLMNYSDHATKMAEVDGDVFIVTDTMNSNDKLYIPVAVSNTILSEEMESFGAAVVNYTSTTGGYIIIGEDGSYDETFHGEEYANIFFGLDGNDIFKAAESTDNDNNELDGDVFFGGDLHDIHELDTNIAGSDTVDYSDYETRGVAVSLSEAAGDSELIGRRAQAYWDGDADGAADRLYSIENIIGTQFADLVEGSYVDNSLFLEGGNDLIIATRGNDFIDGSHGFDILSYNYKSSETELSNVDVDGEMYTVTQEVSIKVTAVNRKFGDYLVEKTYLVSAHDITDPNDDEFITQADTVFGVDRIAHAEHRANTYIPDNQILSSATALLNDGFVVIWQGQNQAGQSYGVFGQRYDIYGQKLDSEFQISSNTGSANFRPQVTSTLDGGFGVVWEGENPSNARTKIFASIFDGDGDAVATDIEVFRDPPLNTGDPQQDAENRMKRTQEFNPSVSVMDDGNIAIVAEAQGDGMNFSDIITQVLDVNSGARIGDDEDSAVNTSTSGNQVQSDVAGLRGGGYVVTWTDQNGTDGNEDGVYGQLFSNSYQPLGSHFRINSNTTYDQANASVAALEGGRFVVAWTSDHESQYSTNIYYRLFDFFGNPVSDDVLVNDVTQNSQVEPDVIGLADGGFLIVFTDNEPTDGSASGIFAQQYDVDGNRIGDNFQVNVTTNASQRQPSVAALVNGDFTISWTSNVPDGGDGEEILYRVYSNTGSTSDQYVPIIDLTVPEKTRYSETFLGDVDSDWQISDNGTSIELNDNTWTKIGYTYTVTSKTVLEFDFLSFQEGEIHAIGFDTDNLYEDSLNTFFQVFGEQTNSSENWYTDFRNYTLSDGKKHYLIEVGTFFIGTFNYLTFINDDDSGSGSNSAFANIRLYEDESIVEYIDLSSLNLSSYQTGQDQNGQINFSQYGEQIDISGNAWKKFDFSYNVTENTYLDFEFRSNAEGEIHSIGLDNDNYYADGLYKNFQLYGTDQGTQHFHRSETYTDLGEWQVFTINIGAFQTGLVSYLTFVNDDDVDASGLSSYRNVRIYESGEENDVVSVTSSVPDVIDLSAQSFSSYSDQDTVPLSFEVTSTSLEIGGNTWKKMVLNYTVTANSVLEFDFSTTAQAEVHGIGLDTNNAHYQTQLLQLYGTQDWGIDDFNNYSGSGVQHYKINLGNYFTGAQNYLTFANDHDAYPHESNSKFENIRIYEEVDPIFDNFFFGTDAAEVFKFEEVAATGKTFSISGFDTQTDSLDLSAVLEMYDPLTQSIVDFVHITDDGADSVLAVDGDGANNGSSYVALATLEGATGLTDEEALEAAGVIVT